MKPYYLSIVIGLRYLGRALPNYSPQENRRYSYQSHQILARNQRRFLQEHLANASRAEVLGNSVPKRHASPSGVTERKSKAKNSDVCPILINVQKRPGAAPWGSVNRGVVVGSSMSLLV